MPKFRSAPPSLKRSRSAPTVTNWFVEAMGKNQVVVAGLYPEVTHVVVNTPDGARTTPKAT